MAKLRRRRWPPRRGNRVVSPVSSRRTVGARLDRKCGRREASLDPPSYRTVPSATLASIGVARRTTSPTQSFPGGARHDPLIKSLPAMMTHHMPDRYRYRRLPSKTPSLCSGRAGIITV